VGTLSVVKHLNKFEHSDLAFARFSNRFLWINSNPSMGQSKVISHLYNTPSVPAVASARHTRQELRFTEALLVAITAVVRPLVRVMDQTRLRITVLNRHLKGTQSQFRIVP
jgi:hypothetical protein